MKDDTRKELQQVIAQTATRLSVLETAVALLCTKTLSQEELAAFFEFFDETHTVEGFPDTSKAVQEAVGSFRARLTKFLST